MHITHWLARFVSRAFSVRIPRNHLANRRSASNSRTSNTPELLESRCLLTSDFGDAPDTGDETGVGDYQTLSFRDGPSHVIDGTATTLFLGATVDGEGQARQTTAANGGDLAAGGDDEDGLVEPLRDLVLTIGTNPAVRVRATNVTTVPATLYGWIDYNRDGVFDNVTERASTTIPAGTNREFFTLSFLTIPVSTSAGKTYARFRLSSDPAAANSTDVATGGEVEDYAASLLQPGDGTVDGTKSIKIASGAVGGPTLANNDLFGTSVASIGDLNGDGVNDLAVGAMGDDTGEDFAGAVYVQMMNSNGTVKDTKKISDGSPSFLNLAQNGAFGSSVAAIGDLNGDGFTELAIGAMRNPGSVLGLPPGGIHILFLSATGEANGNGLIGQSLGGGPALGAADYFGCSVAALGDLDGDGVDDIAVGAYGDETGGKDRGAVYILFMNSLGPGKSLVKSSIKIASGTNGGPTLANDDLFGVSVASLGDLDGDGISDLAVGAEGDDTGGSYRGAVHILMLNADGSVKSSQKIANGLNGGPTLSNLDYFGSSVASLGDLDGDGIGDLAVGAAFDDTNGDSRGAVYLLNMNSNGTAKSHLKLASGMNGVPTLPNSGAFGTSVAALGDLDGDGTTELAVGAFSDNTGGTGRGAVHVLFLKSTAPAPFGLTISPNATTTNLTPIVFTLQFNQPVTGFDLTDITVTNGNSGTFNAIDADTYTLSVTPLTPGPVTVSVDADQAFDPEAHGNPPATATVAYTTEPVVPLSLGTQAVTWIKKGPPVAVFPQLTMNEGIDFAGATISLTMSTIGSKKASLDQVSVPAVQFGSNVQQNRTPTSFTFSVQLGATDSAQAIQTFLRGITFSTKGKGIKSATRKMQLTFTDSAGNTTNFMQTISVRKKG